MTVAMQVNITRRHAYEVTVSVCEKLRSLGFTILLPDTLKDCLKDVGAEFDEQEQCIKRCDIVISIGGDGTIIHSAHFAARYDKPVLGINAGRLGFLAGLEKTELDLLENLLTDNYTIDKRMRLRVRHYEGDRFIKEYTCLNDVFIGRGTSLRLCEINVSSQNKPLYSYLADGLVVATPTGSTAYSFSAGGPVVDTAIESIILTPICNHSLFSRSVIFKPDTELEIKVSNYENCLPLFSCDGDPGITMTENTRLTVSRSDIYSKIIRIKSDSFADILNAKLVERYTHNQGE